MPLPRRGVQWTIPACFSVPDAGARCSSARAATGASSTAGHVAAAPLGVNRCARRDAGISTLDAAGTVTPSASAASERHFRGVHHRDVGAIPYLNYDNRYADLLFEVVTRRYGRQWLNRGAGGIGASLPPLRSDCPGSGLEGWLSEQASINDRWTRPGFSTVLWWGSCARSGRVSNTTRRCRRPVRAGVHEQLDALRSEGPESRAHRVPRAPRPEAPGQRTRSPLPRPRAWQTARWRVARSVATCADWASEWRIHWDNSRKCHAMYPVICILFAKRLISSLPH